MEWYGVNGVVWYGMYVHSFFFSPLSLSLYIYIQMYMYIYIYL